MRSYQHLFSLESSEGDAGDFGGKANNLTKLIQHGIPVPPGFKMGPTVHEYYRKTGDLPPGLVKEVIRAKEQLGGKVSVRSSADCEDGDELSMAGVFLTKYVEEDRDVESTIRAVFDQADSSEVRDYLALHGRNETVDMSIIVEELIKADTAGVIYTTSQDDFVIEYVAGMGNKLVDGDDTGSALIVSSDGVIKESRGFDAVPLDDELVKSLASYASLIKYDIYGGVDQDIEYATVGKQAFFLQARTLTSEVPPELSRTALDALRDTKLVLRRHVKEEMAEFGTKKVVFSDANYSEILPRPAPMDIGVYMYVWGGSDGIPGAKQLGHAAMGYDVGPEATGMIVPIGGRTYFSLAKNAALYHIGIPDTKKAYHDVLIQEYLDVAHEEPERAGYPQMGLFLQDPTMDDLRKRFGDEAERYYQVYVDFTDRLAYRAAQNKDEFYRTRMPEMAMFREQMVVVDLQAQTVEENLDYVKTVLEHIRTASFVNFVEAARLGFYYSQRLRAQLFDSAGSADIADDQFSRLSSGLDNSAITDINLAICAAETDDEAIALAIEEMGHMSSGEMLEVRHPVFRERPDLLADYVRGLRSNGEEYIGSYERQKQARVDLQAKILATTDSEQRSDVALSIEGVQTYMALRETAKFELAKEYELLKRGLDEIEHKLGLHEGDIYFVYPRMLPVLVADPERHRHLIKARKADFELHQQLAIMSVIRDTDIDSLQLRNDNPESFTKATGKRLAPGSTVDGIVVNADDFETTKKAMVVLKDLQERNELIVLVATQMNLGHDPLIAGADGLVIENAGMVAHGAQRAREIGLGALSGIRSANLPTGMRVRFDPRNKTVMKIEE